MHGSLGFVVNNHPTARAKPEDKGGYLNRKSQTSMHYALYSPIWLVLIFISKHTWYFTLVNKVAYRKHHFTTSCGVWIRMYNFLSVYGKYYSPVTIETRVEVENKICLLYPLPTCVVQCHNVLYMCISASIISPVNFSLSSVQFEVLFTSYDIMLLT